MSHKRNTHHVVIACACLLAISAVFTTGLAHAKKGGKKIKASAYQVTYKNCDLEIDEELGLAFTGPDEGRRTIKIRYVKRVPGDMTFDENGVSTDTGVAYILDETGERVIPELTSDAGLHQFFTEVPIEVLETSGTARKITARNCSIGLIMAKNAGFIRMWGAGDMKSDDYETLSVMTEGQGDMKLLLFGVILEKLETSQDVNFIKAFTKKSKSKIKGKKGFSLAGIGRVAPETMENRDETHDEFTIMAHSIKRILTRGAPVVPDAIATSQTIKKIMARTGRFQGQLIEGNIGFEDEETTPLLVVSDNILQIDGENVYGIFVAGADNDGEPNYSGQIKRITTKRGKGVIRGEAHVAPSSEDITRRGDDSEFTIYTEAPPEPDPEPEPEA